MNDKKTPARPIGLVTATFLVIANMIGAGVFVTSGFSYASLENRAIVLAAWGVGSLIALAGAISYGRLVHLIAESGGEYLYLSRFIHPLFGFIAGWVSLLAGFTGAIAFAATTFATYCISGDEQTPVWLAPAIGISTIILFAILHSFNVKGGVWTQNVVVTLKLGIIVVFVVIAMLAFQQSKWFVPPAEFEQSGFSLDTFAGSIVWISLSFSGFNAAVYVTGEVRNASRNVPLALMLGTLVVSVIYLTLNWIFLYAPDPSQISGQQQVATITANAIGGNALEQTVRVVICVSLVSSVSSMLIAGPRVYAKMADDGLFPRMFRIESRQQDGKSPALAIWLQAILASIVVAFVTLQKQLDYLSFILSMSTATTVACLFVGAFATQKGKAKTEGGRKWIYLVIAAIYIIATVTLAIIYAYDKPAIWLPSAIIVGSGIVAFLIFRWRQSKHL